MNVPQVRLTNLAHDGGCGCKLAPSVLQQLLAGHPTVNPYRYTSPTTICAESMRLTAT
jgi:selenide,water dikinase